MSLLIVQKFGGTSVEDEGKIKKVAQRIADNYRKGNKMVVVLSAMGDTTDKLLHLARQVNSSPPDRELSQLLATGEQVSIALLAIALDSLQVPVVSLTGGQAGIFTEQSHVKARIDKINPTKIELALQENKVVVVAGFQGTNVHQDITTLGRGGSDTTAVALAATLKADLCEIYTDVEGVYTADPRAVSGARKLDCISYDEMLEMANLGAQVLHPRAVECAKEYGVNLYVRSTFSAKEGTKIMEGENMEKGTVVRGIACDRNQAKFAIIGVPDQPGMAFKIFDALAKAMLSVDLIVQSVHKNGVNDILFTVERDDASKVATILEPLCQKMGVTEIRCQKNMAKISVVGGGMVNSPGVAAKMFEALASRGVNIEIISTSEIRISCLILEDRLEEAANAIHEFFSLSEE